MRDFRFVYIVAGIISIILYITGILTGVYISNIPNSVEEGISSIRTDMEKIEQEYVLFSLRGKESCAILPSLADEIASKLNLVVNDLIRLENEGETGSKFTELKKTYASLSVRAWILRSAINENCEQNILPILYYYSIPCEDCIQQGNILDNMRSRFNNNVSIYVLDKNIDLQIVKTLVKSHDVQKTPTLVIGDTIRQGLVNEENFTEIVCEKLNMTC